MKKQPILVRMAFVSMALAASLGAFLLTRGPAAVAMAERPSGFCKEAVVKDYLGRLARFDTTMGFSGSGRLRVGPTSLRVYPPRERLITVGRDNLEDRWGNFEAQGSLGTSPPHPPARLAWWVSSRLERVGERNSKVVKAKRQYVPTVNAFRFQDFGFGSRNVKPGIYRLNVRFEARSGKTLADYREYFRAVRPRSNLRLVTNRPTLEPGGTGYLRIENYGTVAATYFFQYRIWSVWPVGNGGGELALPPQIYSAVRPLVRAGYAGSCTKFSVPAETPAGEYRVGLEARDSLSSEPVLLLRRFQVASP
jgi:hypothetical protein